MPISKRSARRNYFYFAPGSTFVLRAVDSHSVFADPDPAVLFNADPDPAVLFNANPDPA